MRCSAARSAIPGHGARGAIYPPGAGRARGCVFGLAMPPMVAGDRHLQQLSGDDSQQMMMMGGGGGGNGGAANSNASLTAVGLSATAPSWSLPQGAGLGLQPLVPQQQQQPVMLPTAAAAIAQSQYESHTRAQQAAQQASMLQASQQAAANVSDSSFTVTSGDTSLADHSGAAW